MPARASTHHEASHALTEVGPSATSARASAHSRDASAEPRLSPTRTRATWKPRVGNEDVDLFACARCGQVYVGLGSTAAGVETDKWRSVIMQPPYAGSPCPTCCGEAAAPVAFAPVQPADVGYAVNFLGGMDANRLVLSWTIGAPKPQLIVVKTFTGILQRSLSPHEIAQRSAVFPLADEDAYCYCDLDPCEHCVASCKRGFAVYVVCEDGSALRLPCGKWQ
ncbi:hypothetical protein [Gordonibacter sp.]|uniref:hypothetical protein n=2 Tax=Gordonibacter sp. TaxID=1968902 RepID=UPI002FC70D68